MKMPAKAMLGALMIAGATVALARPASAFADIGISFGFDGPVYGFDSCDYYDYYDAPPPWGLPDDYCDYPVYFEPVFFDGFWYRGPIFYRWTHGRRLFWLNGGWREDGWRGPRPAAIDWQNRGGPARGFKPGMGLHGGGRDWRDGAGNRHDHDDNGDRPTGDRPWSDGPNHGFGDGGHGGPGGGSHGGFGGGPGHH